MKAMATLKWPKNLDPLAASYNLNVNLLIQVDAVNSTSSRNLRVTCSRGSSRETVLRRDHFGRQPRLRSLDIDGCRIAKVRARFVLCFRHSILSTISDWTKQITRETGQINARAHVRSKFLYKLDFALL